MRVNSNLVPSVVDTLSDLADLDSGVTVEPLNVEQSAPAASDQYLLINS